MKVSTTGENQYGISIHVSGPTRRYMDAFVRLKCAPDLLAERLFPDAKEITESMGAFEAVRKVVGFPAFGDDGFQLFDVGCGALPRTAALFACRSRWPAVAIDPRANDRRSYGINRLTVIAQKIEEVFPLAPIENALSRVVVCVHSHAPLQTVVEKLRPHVLVAIPCCVSQDLPAIPTREYEDHGIWSPKRTVRVWDFR